MQTYAYGFPRLGPNREYKKSIESFWKKEISDSDLKKALDDLQAQMLSQYEGSIDTFPCGEISGYDPMFDTAVMLGLYQPKSMDEYYELCRGKTALEMTKWFNTNYHYLVPDFSNISNASFSVNWNKPKEFLGKFNKGIPALIGPFTFLKLSKGLSSQDFFSKLKEVTAVYKEIISEFKEVHIEEPGFVLELSGEEIAAIKETYQTLSESGCAINVITYYDSVDFLKELFELPVKGIGLDFVHGSAQVQEIGKIGFPEDKTLIAGLVNGRNVWRTDVKAAAETLKTLSGKVKNLVVSNAAPLYHLPISLKGEDALDPALKGILSFAEEKLQEIKTIAELFDGKNPDVQPHTTDFGKNEAVQSRIKGLKDSDFQKSMSYAERTKLQNEELGLPLFPTTTIGSFPQTKEVRKYRADFRKGDITAEEYAKFVKDKMTELVKFQEDLGIDVLVHGEFERTDMVEFFAENLDGIATSKNGWIISYGTRGYRPPMIFGDVARPKPMTIDEIKFAQTLTKRPMKGMLTGPVTIIAWSFVREDIPTSEVAYQIGLALQDEIKDYESSGIKIAQIDEPALREKAPIKRRDWADYFDWAIKSFRLTTNTDPKTQIHTHMCYSEFGEIVKEIHAMDFDVISIETTRSRGDIIESFENSGFDRQIGLGVWDIHSPAIPTTDAMKEVVDRALKVIPKENFWINPDCGLKTRGWEETEACLKHLVTAAGELREAYAEVKA